MPSLYNKYMQHFFQEHKLPMIILARDRLFYYHMQNKGDVLPMFASNIRTYMYKGKPLMLNIRCQKFKVDDLG